MAVITMLSSTTMLMMFQGVAPIALRMPNSWVRSFTVMSIMLLTPTMPLSKVSRPRIQKEVWRMFFALVMSAFSLAEFQIQSAERSSEANS